MAILRDLLQDSADQHQKQLVTAALAAAEVLAPEQPAVVARLPDLSVDEALATLREIRATLPDARHDPDSGSFVRLDQVIFPLLCLQRDTALADMLGPYPDYSSPFDVLISDIKPEDLPIAISRTLGVAYLCPGHTAGWPISGTVYGLHHRIIFSLPVTIRSKSVQVHFIFDTGAPKTYIALSVLEALEVPEVALGSEVVRINGVKTDVCVSDTSTVYLQTSSGEVVETPCHFKGLNLMGMDFLDRVDGTLTVNMAANRAVLDRPQQ